MSRLSLIAVIVAVLVAWCAAYPAKAGPYSEVEVPAFEYHLTTVWPYTKAIRGGVGTLSMPKATLIGVSLINWILFPWTSKIYLHIKSWPEGILPWLASRVGRVPRLAPKPMFGPVHGTAWRLYNGTVPEPSGLALVGLGLVALALRKSWRSSRLNRWSWTTVAGPRFSGSPSNCPIRASTRLPPRLRAACRGRQLQRAHRDLHARRLAPALFIHLPHDLGVVPGRTYSIGRQGSNTACERARQAAAREI